MPPRHLRQPVHHPLLRRLRAIGLLVPVVAMAAAAAAGSMLSRPVSAAYLGSQSAVLNAAAPGIPGDASRFTPQPTNSVRLPGKAPAKATPAAPKPAAPKPPSRKVLDFDFQLQVTYYYCAPAATHMALSAHGISYGQDALAGLLHTTENGTDSVVDTTRALNDLVHTGFYQSHSIPGPGASAAQVAQFQADVVHAISSGYGVVANIAGAATDLAGVTHEFDGGHFIAVVGYSEDGRSVKVADSSGMFGPGTYWMSSSAITNWMAHHGYSA
jgi:hypothetical protein